MSRRSVLATMIIVVVSLMTLTGIVLAVVFAARGGAPLPVGGGRIAVLEIDGVIDDDRAFLEQLKRFRRDRSVRGYLVHIDSPGGAVGPSQSIYQELRRLRDSVDVPVVAAISGIGASGGYYIALAADTIFALPGSITGSIGVIMELPDASRLMERIGVRWQTVQSAEHKDIGSPFRPMSEGDREILHSLVDDVYRQFVEAVATERRLDVARVEQLADGRILSGRQAVQAGLVDRLGNREDALAAVGAMAGLGSEPRTIRPPEDRPRLIDFLIGRMAGAVMDRLARPLDRSAAAPRVRFVVPW